MPTDTRNRRGSYDLAFLWGLIAFFGAIIAFCIWGTATRETTTVECEVIERQFTKGFTSIGTGVGSKGEVVVSSSHEPDKWTAVFRTPDGPMPVAVRRRDWEKYTPGLKCMLRRCVSNAGGVSYRMAE